MAENDLIDYESLSNDDNNQRPSKQKFLNLNIDHKDILEFI